MLLLPITMLVILLLSSLTTIVAKCPTDTPTVQISEGNIRGVCKTSDVGDVTTFLGVPFAEPPMGRLRFQPPQRPLPWSGTRDASTFSTACIQKDEWLQGQFDDDFYTSSEDCLYLNVYVPGYRDLGDSSLAADLAVMVWIHGGEFERGTASLYDPSRLVSSTNVIVVTINYRLGVIGFLSIQEGDIGNFGLRDQTMALSWVQRNIAIFGGDKNRVTLFGHEAGAASILRHLASAKSRGLFHRAICQSVMPITSLEHPARNTTERLSVNLRCASSDMDETMACLRSRAITDIYDSVKKLRQQLSVQDTHLFGPSNGDNWMPVPYNYNFTYGLYYKYIQVIMGTGESEGAKSLYFRMDRNAFELNMEIIAKGLEVTDYKKVAKMMLSHYLRDEINGDFRNAIAAVTNDIHTALTQDLVRKLATHGTRIFNYRFSHQPSFASIPYYLNSEHDDFISFVMGRFTNFESDERVLSKQIMAAWSFFAQTGTPMFERVLHLTWPPYLPNNRSYVDLQMPLGADNRKIRLKEAADIFWNEVLQTFRSSPTTPTAPPTTTTVTPRPLPIAQTGTLFGWTIDQSEIAILVLVIVCGASLLVCIVVVISHVTHRQQEVRRNSMYNVMKTNNKPLHSIKRKHTKSKGQEVNQNGKEKDLESHVNETITDEAVDDLSMKDLSLTDQTDVHM